jgi:hypothetical protein
LFGQRRRLSDVSIRERTMTIATHPRQIMPADPQANSQTAQPGTTLALDVLSEPGAYVCNWSGHLLRVRPDAFPGGRQPGLNIIGDRPLTVTKISDDPDVVISKAKRLAAFFKLEVNF